ncbi:hypothetical protein RR46_11519 [Papilio xuthus]|uniref:Uncharacterized protein n=1 Tax=Papilio xuthus TaxID=66420 RepID=A0A194PQT1_PAPXU|nr:hypothetical protein RR46_11519 [Papilio xuthus]
MRGVAPHRRRCRRHARRRRRRRTGICKSYRSHLNISVLMSLIIVRDKGTSAKAVRLTADSDELQIVSECEGASGSESGGRRAQGSGRWALGAACGVQYLVVPGLVATPVQQPFFYS